MKLEQTIKFKAFSEEEAKELLEKYRTKACEEGYQLKKGSYEYKAKKAKGEVVEEAWIVSITQIFGSLWEA